MDAAGGRELTSGALDHAIGRFAAGLAAQGFKPGDVLLLFAPNSPEWPSPRSAPWPPAAW